MPGLLVASIQRCPVFGGTIKRYDATKAKALPGVRAVVELEPSAWTGKDGAWGVGCAAGVAVVADTYWYAFRGRKALELKWNGGQEGSPCSDCIRGELRPVAEECAGHAQ